METDEQTFRITWYTGTVTLKEPVWKLVWTSYDSFDVEGEYVSMRDCRAEDLGMVCAMYRNLEFANERPEPPLGSTLLGRALNNVWAAFNPPPPSPPA